MKELEGQNTQQSLCPGAYMGCSSLFLLKTKLMNKNLDFQNTDEVVST